MTGSHALIEMPGAFHTATGEVAFADDWAGTPV
jgi:hypothetical protein